MNNQGISLHSIVRFSLVFARNYRCLGKTENWLTSHWSTVTDLKHHYYMYIDSYSRTERHWITKLETRVQFPAIQFFFFSLFPNSPEFSRKQTRFWRANVKTWCRFIKISCFFINHSRNLFYRGTRENFTKCLFFPALPKYFGKI